MCNANKWTQGEGWRTTRGEPRGVMGTARWSKNEDASKASHWTRGSCKMTFFLFFAARDEAPEEQGDQISRDASLRAVRRPCSRCLRCKLNHAAKPRIHGLPPPPDYTTGGTAVAASWPPCQNKRLICLICSSALLCKPDLGQSERACAPLTCFFVLVQLSSEFQVDYSCRFC